MHFCPRLFLICSLTACSLPTLSNAETIPGANGLELTEFAREPLVRNAVAVTVDERDNVFVTSVVRRQAADLDIRRFREWIETELGFTSVEEKRAWFKVNLTPENSAKFTGRFEDHNGDGSWDFADLSLLSDKITRLTDTDGVGLADEFIKFNAAENSEVTGIAAGLAAWDGAIYATVEPDLVKLTDPDGDGIFDHRDVLATGFSVHIGYGGHNFSGAIIGPDGRLYASVADRGMNVTDRAGVNHYNPHSGAIVRCELDGSNFEIFAYGLRNTQEPAFDAFGNLFGVDNDGDFKTEKERLVYITEGSDTGWRTNWQYRGDDWLPWMDERLAFPAHDEQPSYITPALQLYKDGPAGFAFNPGTALNPFYRDHFFMTAFPSRNLYAFQLEPDGAAYRMTGEHNVAQGALMVGMSFSPSGALYIADWSSSGYDMNEKGAVWKLDDPTQANSIVRQKTAQLFAQNWADETSSGLRQHLSYPDQRVRMKAQFEIVKRNDAQGLLSQATNRAVPQLGRIHAIWGLGQLHRRGDHVSTKSIQILLSDPNAEVRAQTAKIISDGGIADSEVRKTLRVLLNDPADRPRLFAAIALGKLGDESSRDALVDYLNRDGSDRFHRHAAVMGLAGGVAPAEIAALSAHPNRHVRLAAIVALRRLRSTEVTAFLNDSDALVVAEAASAIHDDESIPDALPALAQLLSSSQTLHERTQRRALSAALRLRDAPFAQLVADFAAVDTHSSAIRLHALTLLNDWLTPARLDTVEGRYRPLKQAWPERLALSVETSLTALSKSADPEIAQAAWEAAAKFGIQQTPADLIAIFNQDTPLSAAALAQLSNMNVAGIRQYTNQAMDSHHSSVKQQALRVIAKIAAADLAGYVRKFIDDQAIAEARTGIELMSRSTQTSAIVGVRTAINKLLRGELDSALSLDALTAASKSQDRDTLAILELYRKSKDSSDPLSPYLETLHGGDAVKGQTVFETSVAAQCTLCHRIGRRGSNVGPALTEIGERDSRYILESLVDPGAVVAPGFGMTSVTLKSGESIAGTLMGSTDEGIKVKAPDGKVHRIKTGDIANRTPAMSSMPPMGTLMSRYELRDLITYLQTLVADKN